MFSNSTMETVAISEETVNPTNEKIGPESFELLKVLGKGGYGKVCYTCVNLKKDYSGENYTQKENTVLCVKCSSVDVNRSKTWSYSLVFTFRYSKLGKWLATMLGKFLL